MVKLLLVLKKFLLLVGTLVIIFVLIAGATIAAALLGKAQVCPKGSGVVRNENQLLYLVETKGLTIEDSEATALVQKSLSEKVTDPRVCFTEGLVHLSGNIKGRRISPSFYVSTGIDASGPTPKTKNLDIRIGGLPNLFIFTPIEKMIEGIINYNLSQARMEGKYSIEFSSGSATIKKIK